MASSRSIRNEVQTKCKEVPSYPGRFTLLLTKLKAVPIMASLAAPELLESVYNFLIKNGHESTAKSLAKEAKLDEKKMSSKTPIDLMDICPPSLK